MEFETGELKNKFNPLLNNVLKNYEAMAMSTAVSKTYKQTVSRFLNRMAASDDPVNLRQAMRGAIRELSEQGISTIDYKSGRRSRMDSAVRNAMMTEFDHIAQQIEQQIALDIGTDGWEISAHQHCAADHEPLQGHTFANEEYEKLQNGDVAKDIEGEEFQIDRPIGWWNCRHIAFPVILGVSEPSFSPEELEKIKERNEEGADFRGEHYTLYEAEQLQRRYETEMRYEREKLNLLKEVKDADPAMHRDYRKSRDRLAALRGEYKELGAVLAPKAIRMKMERSYAPTSAYGADTGGLRDKGKTEQERHANTYYESIRNRKSKSDIASISKNTGFTLDQVSTIREHIFTKEHNLGDGVMGRFEPYYRIAQAWQRLEQGKGTEMDILLLQHELEEWSVMERYGYDYPTAHAIAHKKYPWSEKDMEGK